MLVKLPYYSSSGCSCTLLTTSLLITSSFNDNFYRHVPVLEPCTSIRALYQSSTILFWTILLTSCQYCRPHIISYEELLPHQHKLLTSRLVGKPSMELVHVLLLLGVFPPPLLHQHDDPCWSSCGTAVNMAMQLGFHRPDSSYEYFRPMDKVVTTAHFRRRTWLVCFIVSTRYVKSVRLGQQVFTGGPGRLQTG